MRPFSLAGPRPGWVEFRLGRLLNRSKRTGEPQLPLLSVNLPEGVVVRGSELDERPAPSEDLASYLVVKPDALVVNPLGKPHGSLGVSRYAGITSPAYFVADIDERAAPRFLHYLLRTRLYISEYERRGKWMPPSQFNISWDQFKLIRLDLPARPIQEEIADFLGRECERISSLIGALEAQESSLTQLRASATHEVAVSLRRVPLKHAATVVDCKHRTADYVDAGWPIVSTREVTPGLLRLDDATRKVTKADFDDLRGGGRDVASGDIIYSRNASVGVASLVPDGAEVCLGQDVVLITRRPRDCELLSYALNWAVLDQIEQLSIGSTFSRLNVPAIRELVVPDDTPAKEEAAVTRLRSIFGGADASERVITSTIDLFTEYRDALITEAVTGKLDVTHLSEQLLDESARAALEGEPPEVLA